ncbi:arsenate reductase family protein [Paenibacillus hemerocallicola]|uniref:Arsenate reductase family protein n=1 Tax=Paenibacillus hemerocallicola TaxID=1172614 RepID=A0A5C4T346_9BACL|nr:arsenate reductase family protein [Paenibacillus hemerocallicola]TNJ63160.1 arsenate reductase family protein [Paenibacillus hemerocallicola]
MSKQQSVSVYLYPKCGTCRDALKSLDRKGVRPDETVNIFETPPSRDRMAEMIAKSGLPMKKFFNTSGEVYKEMQLKDKLSGMSEAEMIDLLASNGRLIKRPIVYDGERVTVGFKEDEYERVWKRS